MKWFCVLWPQCQLLLSTSYFYSCGQCLGSVGILQFSLLFSCIFLLPSQSQAPHILKKKKKNKPKDDVKAVPFFTGRDSHSTCFPTSKREHVSLFLIYSKCTCLDSHVLMLHKRLDLCWLINPDVMSSFQLPDHLPMGLWSFKLLDPDPWYLACVGESLLNRNVSLIEIKTVCTFCVWFYNFIQNGNVGRQN